LVSIPVAISITRTRDKRSISPATMVDPSHLADSPLRGFGSITGITAATGPLNPLEPRVHPEGGPQPFSYWLARSPAHASRSELEVRFSAAMRGDVFNQRYAALVATHQPAPTSKVERKRAKTAARTTLCREAGEASDSAWEMFSALHKQLSMPPPQPHFGTKTPPRTTATDDQASLGSSIGEALQRSLSGVLGPSSRAHAKPRIIDASVLIAPFGVSQFIQSVQLSCPSESPKAQLLWAVESLDAVSYEFVQEQTLSRGSRPRDLSELETILLLQHPSEDEHYRLFENMFKLMKLNPSSVAGFYVWSAKMLRVFEQARAGRFPVPASMSISILLSGLACVPGATSPAGIYSSLRATCKGQECSGITDPRAFVDKVRQLFTAQEASATAARLLAGSAPPTRSASAHVADVVEWPGWPEAPTPAVPQVAAQSRRGRRWGFVRH
jgi:hypothetical protein